MLLFATFHNCPFWSYFFCLFETTFSTFLKLLFLSFWSYFFYLFEATFSVFFLPLSQSNFLFGAPSTGTWLVFLSLSLTHSLYLLRTLSLPSKAAAVLRWWAHCDGSTTSAFSNRTLSTSLSHSLSLRHFLSLLLASVWRKPNNKIFFLPRKRKEENSRASLLVVQPAM